MANQPRPEPVKKARAGSVPFSEGIILVNTNFAPMAMDCGAEAIIDDLKNGYGASGGNHELPEQILEFLVDRSDSDSEGWQLNFTAGGHEYSCRAFTVKPKADAVPMIALHLRREFSLVDVVRQIATEYHLTEREQQALMGISMGLSSKEVATEMKISPNTVKAFLRLIMIKMGTASRAGLIAKLLDQNGFRGKSQMSARTAAPHPPRLTAMPSPRAG